jgi:chromosome segregation protein
VTEKLETLKTERQSIFDFMETVELKKRETFMTAFEVIKSNFEKIYKEISGGEGTLILDNPREISDCGLLIAASPKGKKMMNLDLMSGGEKVLTTSAFLLSIQRYKPSHFYIVDELDAALDRENSMKLAEMLAKTSAQFLLITHNEALMKYAQSVIGVSMSNGVSQIVGVKLTDNGARAEKAAL